LVRRLKTGMGGSAKEGRAGLKVRRAGPIPRPEAVMTRSLRPAQIVFARVLVLTVIAAVVVLGGA
jgi:hypothetical protein